MELNDLAAKVGIKEQIDMKPIPSGVPASPPSAKLAPAPKGGTTAKVSSLSGRSRAGAIVKKE